MIVHVQINDSFNISLFLSVCVGGPIICFHLLPSEFPVLLMFPTEISFIDKRKKNNFARFEFNMTGYPSFHTT